MERLTTLGTVVATQEGPTSQEFNFVISDHSVRDQIESGTFVQVEQNGELIIGIVQSLRRTNRYYSSSDLIHGSSKGMSVQSVYPSELWDYIIGKVKALGSIKNSMKRRATKPVLPGAKVFATVDNVLRSFLGIKSSGLHLGSVRQSNVMANIDIDRLLQKHLAILSISGGGKSYATSVLIEEIMKREPNEGRPAVVLFDVHGEYNALTKMEKDRRFHGLKVETVFVDSVNMALGNMSIADYSRIFPDMSNPQKRDLSYILMKLRQDNKPLTVDKIIQKTETSEINQYVKEALLGWLYQMRSTYLFGNLENPDLKEQIKPGKLLIFDLSQETSLWKKRIIVHYFLSRMFELRRQRMISPVVTFIEEAHQFAPETEVSSSKSIIHTIAREGRKFLCSLVLISQRPINLSTTALSQCNSHLILRILNPYDLSYIGKSSEGINQETLQMLTSLGVGEALLVGEAVNYPVFVQIRKKIISAEFDDTLLSLESRKFEKNIAH